MENQQDRLPTGVIPTLILHQKRPIPLFGIFNLWQEEMIFTLFELSIGKRNLFLVHITL